MTDWLVAKQSHQEVSEAAVECDASAVVSYNDPLEEPAMNVRIRRSVCRVLKVEA